MLQKYPVYNIIINPILAVYVIFKNTMQTLTPTSSCQP